MIISTLVGIAIVYRTVSTIPRRRGSWCRIRSGSGSIPARFTASRARSSSAGSSSAGGGPCAVLAAPEWEPAAGPTPEAPAYSAGGRSKGIV